MWANSMFNMEESRSSLTPATIFPSHNYNSYSVNNWRTAPSFAPAYQPPAINSRYAFPESKPSPPLPTSAPHRVMAFHSSASWKDYFHASKATDKLIVVDFTAAWCGPCRKMEPALDELAAKYTDVDFAKIDVDKLFDVSCEYGVQTMPTFLLMKKGKVLDKVTGTRKEELQRKIEKYRV